MKRRVVVTGLGVISSIGIGKDNFWESLIAGKSGNLAAQCDGIVVCRSLCWYLVRDV